MCTVCVVPVRTRAAVLLSWNFWVSLEGSLKAREPLCQSRYDCDWESLESIWSSYDNLFRSWAVGRKQGGTLIGNANLETASDFSPPLYSCSTFLHLPKATACQQAAGFSLSGQIQTTKWFSVDPTKADEVWLTFQWFVLATSQPKAIKQALDTKLYTNLNRGSYWGTRRACLQYFSPPFSL